MASDDDYADGVVRVGHGRKIRGAVVKQAIVGPSRVASSGMVAVRVVVVLRVQSSARIQASTVSRGSEASWKKVRLEPIKFPGRGSSRAGRHRTAAPHASAHQPIQNRRTLSAPSPIRMRSPLALTLYSGLRRRLTAGSNPRPESRVIYTPCMTLKLTRSSGAAALAKVLR